MSEQSKPHIVGVVGPTASGKTDYAINLCLARGGEIVSCDSMQIYRGMDIGTAKPTLSEMRGIPHHMIDIADINESYSAAKFAEAARECIDDILSRGKLPVLCGGTGLYFDSVVNNIRYKKSEGDPELRRALKELAVTKGNEYVHDILRRLDPVTADNVHPNNLHRVIRAIEICKENGKPKSEVDREQSGEPLYDAEIYGLRRGREELYDRINRRVDAMMEAGLLDEVRTLLSKGADRSSTAMQAIGYKELVAYIDGKCSLDDAAENIKRETRRYAKRQITWFKRNKNIIWLDR